MKRTKQTQSARRGASNGVVRRRTAPGKTTAETFCGSCQRQHQQACCIHRYVDHLSNHGRRAYDVC